MIQLRAQGLEEDIEKFAQTLRDSGIVEVLDVSPPYANRSPSLFVRCYLTVELNSSSDEARPVPPRRVG